MSFENLKDFLSLVNPKLHGRSGSVFYSGASAFSESTNIYVLGLNPGGDPQLMSGQTIGHNIEQALARRTEKWSHYVDESWNGKPPGTAKMQPRIQHLFKNLGLDIRDVPASNVVFVRSIRESAIASEKSELLRTCWPVHEALINRLGIRIILCLGGTSGSWVRDIVGANTISGTFVECNERRWTSIAHTNKRGLHVITLTHPSIAAWTTPSSDPTPLVKSVIAKL